MDKLTKILTHTLNTIMWILGFWYILTSGGFVTGVALTILTILICINFVNIKKKIIEIYDFLEYMYFNIFKTIHSFRKNDDG